MFYTTGALSLIFWLIFLLVSFAHSDIQSSQTILMIFLNSFMIRKKMKIEFKNVATVADIKKAFEKAEIQTKLK